MKKLISTSIVYGFIELSFWSFSISFAMFWELLSFSAMDWASTTFVTCDFTRVKLSVGLLIRLETIGASSLAGSSVNIS